MTFDFSTIHFNLGLLIKEMEKRGVEVTHIKGTSTIIAKYKGRTEIMDDIDSSIMPASLRFMLDNKWSTKKLLEKYKFPVPKGILFNLDEPKKALAFAKKHLPVVLKPVKGAHGFGVRPGIDTMEELEVEIEKLQAFLSSPKGIILEEHVMGGDFRLTVTNNGFFAAVYRTCPKVVGDGNQTIRELIEFENYKRMHPRKNCLCEIWFGDNEIDRYLGKKGRHLEQIPKKGETVYLRINANVCTGGECIDVTELVHPYYKKLAFSILTKIPGLPYCGIDLITADITKYRKGTKMAITEINPSPGISLHTHPSSGKPRALDKAMVDLIFPETI